MPDFKKIAKTTDLSDGSGIVAELDGKKIAVFNSGGKFFAIDNTCIHAGASLGEGYLSGETVTCPWHAWEYDIRSGNCRTKPGGKVNSYPVKIENEDILISI